MKRYLNLGCGSDIRWGADGVEESWLNLDIQPGMGVDVVRDVRQGLPFANNFFDLVFAKDFMEHIAPGDDLVFVINETYRVLKDDGIFHVVVPAWDSGGAYRDPTHKSYFDKRSVEYWGQHTRFSGRARGITADFALSEKIFEFESDRVKYLDFKLKALWKADNPAFRELHPTYYRNEVKTGREDQ